MIIESAIFDRNGERCRESFESKVYNKYGDVDVKVGKTNKIDAALKFYLGVPLMINNNKCVREERGDGKKCGLSVKMKRYCVVDCKNWDGKLVHIVSALDVEYMLCETAPENENKISKNFKLKIDKDSATVIIKVGNMKHKVQVKMVQFEVNSN